MSSFSSLWTLESFQDGARLLVRALSESIDAKVDGEDLTKWTIKECDETKYGGGEAYLVHPPVVTRNHQEDATEPQTHDDDDDEEGLVDETIVEDPDTTLLDCQVDNCHIFPSASAESSVLLRPPTRQISWSFSVAYSDTWQVPVLYFAVSFLDKGGSPCPHQLVVSMLQGFHHQNRQFAADENEASNQRQSDQDDLGVGGDDNSSSWDFVSYEEHPVTGVPSFFLHPCKTRERLDLLLPESEGATQCRAVCPSPLDNDQGFEALLAARRLWSFLSMTLPAVGHAIPSRVYKDVQGRLSSKSSTFTVSS